MEPLVESQKKLLKSTHTLTFKVQTPKFHWEVRRADTDFQFVHAYLSRTHPHILLPPMPFKQSKSTEPKHLQKRGRIYDRYLKYLLRAGSSEEVRGDYLLVQFLSQMDRKDFDNVIKQYSSSTGIQYGAIKQQSCVSALKDLVTAAGEVEVNESQYQNIVRDETIPDFVKAFEGSYRRLYQHMKRLSDDINSVKSTISEIKECIDEIGSVHQMLSNGQQSEEEAKGIA